MDGAVDPISPAAPVSACSSSGGADEDLFGVVAAQGQMYPRTLISTGSPQGREADELDGGGRRAGPFRGGARVDPG